MALCAALVVCGSALAAAAAGAGGPSPPLTGKPWIDMDYGPFLTASIEVESGNIAYKGVAIRLDGGPGGVSHGHEFILFDTDTLRCAAGWTGAGCIDWKSVVFDGSHQTHPSIRGRVVFRNPVGPGWGEPGTGSFEDRRLRGRDGRAYGPLPRGWARWRGLYLHGNEVVLSYSVGETAVLELAGVEGGRELRAWSRSFEIGPRRQPLILQVAHEPGCRVRLVPISGRGTAADDQARNAAAVFVPAGAGAAEQPASERQAGLGRRFSGDTSLEVDGSDHFDFTNADFSIYARFRTTKGGTILAKAPRTGPWAPNGKALFIRNGRLCYDIGWVGVVQTAGRVNDGRWHETVMTYECGPGLVCLYVDGELSGRKRLKPTGPASGQVVRLGYASPDFPGPRSYFTGTLAEVRVYQRRLRPAEVAEAGRSLRSDPKLLARWLLHSGPATAPVPDGAGHGHMARPVTATELPGQAAHTAAAVIGGPPGTRWVTGQPGHLRLSIPAGTQPVRLKLVLALVPDAEHLGPFVRLVGSSRPPPALLPLTAGGPPRWPQKLVTRASALTSGNGPFAVDVLTVPLDNPYRSWMRLGGFDFFTDPRRAAVCTWMGDVWLVDGLSDRPGKLTWQRVATGLFQPLGLKVVDDTIYVLGRDQITRLHDLNGDGEADYYENFNNDAQVTDHFHEFAMDLQTGPDGNFYYTKGGRHALDALVPQHGTLIRVSRDGRRSDILATGFRAPNGLAVNDDGSFIVSDQEGHWTPENRINWVRPGRFYGYMWSYTAPSDANDYEPPLCWVHKGLDRSPAEQLWVESRRWGPLNGSLLSLSYGTGRIWLVPFEWVGDRVQGGIVRLPVPELPTGIQRGRFHPGDGQLYVCGLVGWSTNKTQPGGFYRIRYTGEPLHLPVKLHATRYGVAIGFTGPVDSATAGDLNNYSVQRWQYRRTANYGSDDYRLSDGQPGRDPVPVTGVRLSDDRRVVLLQIPDMKPCMQMGIRYSILAADGTAMEQQIQHTVHALAGAELLARLGFKGDLRPPPRPSVHQPAADQLAPGLALTVRQGLRAGPVADVRAVRMPALWNPPGHSPSPFMEPGPFSAVWEGLLRIDRKGKYQFGARGSGELAAYVNGRQVLHEVLRAAGRWSIGEPRWGPAAVLPAGWQKLRVELLSQGDGRGAVRLYWRGPGFAPEPLPPQRLRHGRRTPGLAHYDALRLGRRLYATRNCWRCHAEPPAATTGRAAAMPELDRDNPSLAGVGSRLSANWMFAWILDPRALRADATMPRMFNAPDDPEQRRQAADIAAYLATLREPAGRPVSGRAKRRAATGSAAARAPTVTAAASAGAPPDGLALFEDLGCIACHSVAEPGEPDRFGRTSLYYAASKFRPGELAAYLTAPRGHYGWSRMPQFGLERSEAAALAAWLRAQRPPRLPQAGRQAAADPARGRQLFRTKRCIYCHSTEPADQRKPAALQRLPAVLHRPAEAGCLSRRPVPSRPADRSVPWFYLSDRERDALSEFLATDGRSLYRSVPALVAQRWVQELKCGQCHRCDGRPAQWPLVLAEEGLRGQFPELLPPLTWAGEKLHVEWLERLLAGRLPQRPRPWLRARMPAFPARASWLANGLAAQHGFGPGRSSGPHLDPRLAAVGARLALKDTGFYCTQCHAVGQKPAEAPFDSQGINFARIASRLRYEYYRRWALNPQRVDPRSKMPKFSSDGLTTSVTAILGGDARRQFDALWHYLLQLNRRHSAVPAAGQ